MSAHHSLSVYCRYSCRRCFSLADISSAPSAMADAITDDAQALRAMLDIPDLSELTCQRFLRANDGHLKRAAKQYKKFLAWREREAIDGILDEPPHEPEIEAEVVRCSMKLLEGCDLKGRPVMVSALGVMDMPALKKRGITHAMLIRRHARAMEQLIERIYASTDPISGHLLILDLSGCTLTMLFWAWPYIRDVAHMGQVYYPEVLGKLCFIRGPEKAAWAVDKVKHYLNPATRDKVDLHCGSDIADFLRAHLPSDMALPPEIKMGVITSSPTEELAASDNSLSATAHSADEGVVLMDTPLDAPVATEAVDCKLVQPADLSSWRTRPFMLRMGCGQQAGVHLGFNDVNSVFPFETELFVGKVYVRVRGLPGEPTEYFAGRKRQMSTVVQGRIKTSVRMCDLSTGFEFDHPILHLPARAMLRMAISFFKSIAPGLMLDLVGERPFIISPLFHAVQRLHIASPGDEPDITVPFAEETTLLGGAFAESNIPWQQRKKMFHSRSGPPGRCEYALDPSHVVTMEFYEDKLVPATFDMVAGPLRISMLRMLGAGTQFPQPLQTMCKMGYEPRSRENPQYLFNIEMWHDSLFGSKAGTTTDNGNAPSKLADSSLKKGSFGVPSRRATHDPKTEAVMVRV